MGFIFPAIWPVYREYTKKEWFAVTLCYARMASTKKSIHKILQLKVSVERITMKTSEWHCIYCTDDTTTQSLWSLEVPSELKM